MVRMFIRLTILPNHQTLPLVSIRTLSLELYERDFTKDFLDMASRGYDWTFFDLLSDLRSGKFNSGSYGPTADDVDAGHKTLLRLAEYLCERIDAFPPRLGDVKRNRNELISCLALDGFSLVGERFIPSESAVINQPEEVSLLKQLLKQAAFPNKKVILEHFRQGEDLFVQQKWGPAIGGWRNFFEAVLRDIGEMTSLNRPDVKKPRNSMKEVFEYLEFAGFFDADEHTGMGSTYGFLCSGAHPGISEEHKARMGMVLALTSGQMVVTKYLAWRNCGFRGFAP
jgi:hypothetical protein